jgi:predicted deacylase
MMKKTKAMWLPLVALLAACAQQAVVPPRQAAASTSAVYQGQGPREAVDTSSRPTDKQRKGVFPFEADGVYFSNEFDGARMNGIARTGPRAYTMTITPENAPINMSPWYAFKVWSSAPGDIAVTLVYPAATRHRYTPQLSHDGAAWSPLAAGRIADVGAPPVSGSVTARPASIVMTLPVETRPLWVAGQELQTSQHVFAWMDSLAGQRNLAVTTIGTSTGGRPIKLLTIGNRDGKKAIFIMGRQHPPEVTGYFAMQAFVGTLAGDSPLAQQFRRDWTIYVVPLMNPDGVDGGFWRHNVGGVDLNRDWSDFHQPETRAVRDFLQQRSDAGARFYFGIDFHSTWDDIYYTIAPKYKGNMPGLVPAWLAQVQKAIPHYKPVIQEADKIDPTTVSRNYFLKAYGMEAITFEIGDNTPRALIQQKGEVGATELMQLMLAKSAP